MHRHSLVVLLVAVFSVGVLHLLTAAEPKKILVEEPTKENEFIFGYWEPDELWYPAKIEKQEDGKVFLRYFDGESEWKEPAMVGRCELAVGSRVYGNWKNKGWYYAGQIARIKGEKIRIEYDDGDVEETTLGAIRMNLDAPAMRKVGMRGLALWEADGYWYPASIITIKDGKYQVKWDDGQKSWLQSTEVFKYTVSPGDRVEGNWLNGGKYYTGVVKSKKGKRIHICYDDGDEEDTSVDMVRMQLRVKK